MSIFAAAAQVQIRNHMIGTVGATASTLTGAIGEFLGSRIFRRNFWTRTSNTVAKVGLAVMDVGSMVVTAGWRVVIYGFFVWASVGLIRNIGRIATAVIGQDFLRAIPSAVEATA